MRNGPYTLVIAPPDYPGMKYRGRYAYEHRVVWWQNTGELPPPGFDVHHKDEIKTNNKFENLELKRHTRHTADHNASRVYSGPVHRTTVARRAKRLLAGSIIGITAPC